MAAQGTSGPAAQQAANGHQPPAITVAGLTKNYGEIQAETPEGGRKRYALTAEGREYVATHADEVRAPWDDVASSVGTDAIELRKLFGAVAMAGMQVVQVGTAAQVTQAQQTLTDTRRKLYAILAADDDASEE